MSNMCFSINCLSSNITNELHEVCRNDEQYLEIAISTIIFYFIFNSVLYLNRHIPANEHERIVL